MYYLQLCEYQSDGETMGAVSVTGWVDISVTKILIVGVGSRGVCSRRPVETIVA